MWRWGFKMKSESCVPISQLMTDFWWQVTLWAFHSGFAFFFFLVTWLLWSLLTVFKAGGGRQTANDPLSFLSAAILTKQSTKRHKVCGNVQEVSPWFFLPCQFFLSCSCLHSGGAEGLMWFKMSSDVLTLRVFLRSFLFLHMCSAHTLS